MTYHIATPIDAAIREAEKGVDLFGMSKSASLIGLNALLKEGKEYVPCEGCNNLDDSGRCKGHENEAK